MPNTLADYDDTWLRRAFAYAEGSLAHAEGCVPDPLHDEAFALDAGDVDLSNLVLSPAGRAHMRLDWLEAGGAGAAFDALVAEIPLTTYETFGRHWRAVHQASKNGGDWRAALGAIKAGG